MFVGLLVIGVNVSNGKLNFADENWLVEKELDTRKGYRLVSMTKSMQEHSN